MVAPYRDEFVDPPPSPKSHNSSSSSLFSGGGNVGTTMFMIVGVLLCAFLLSFAVTASIRFFLRHLRQRPPSPPTSPRKQSDVLKTAALTAFVFPAEMAGSSSECAICLTEFVEGDGVSVLTACRHGFHSRCIEGWLVSSCSCPTCRRCCRLPVTAEEEIMHRNVDMEEP